jgi:RNA polymerase subunit RPABC4/transcription elongation factor Spt4
MPVVATIVICKKCKYEIRSDWKFCPMCGDKIVCHKTTGVSSARAKSAKKPVKKTTKKTVKK